MFISAINDKVEQREEDTADFIIPTQTNQNFTVDAKEESILPKVDFSQEIAAMQVYKEEKKPLDLIKNKVNFTMEFKTKIKAECDILSEKLKLSIQNEKINLPVEVKLEILEKNILSAKVDPLLNKNNVYEYPLLSLLNRIFPSEFSFLRKNDKEIILISLNQIPSNNLFLPEEFKLDPYLLDCGTHKIDGKLKKVYEIYLKTLGDFLCPKLFVLPAFKIQKSFWDNSFFILNIFQLWFTKDLKDENLKKDFFKNLHSNGVGFFFGQSFDLLGKKLCFVFDSLGYYSNATYLSEVDIALLKAKIFSLSLQFCPDIYYSINKFSWKSSFEIKIATWLSGIVDAILPGLTNKFFDILDLGFALPINIKESFENKSLRFGLKFLIKFMMAILFITAEMDHLNNLKWDFCVKIEAEQKNTFSSLYKENK